MINLGLGNLGLSWWHSRSWIAFVANNITTTAADHNLEESSARS